MSWRFLNVQNLEKRVLLAITSPAQTTSYLASAEWTANAALVESRVIAAFNSDVRAVDHLMEVWPDSTFEPPALTNSETIARDHGLTVVFKTTKPKALSEGVVPGEVNRFGTAEGGVITVGAEVVSTHAIEGQLYGGPGRPNWVSIDGRRQSITPGVTIIALPSDSAPKTVYTFERPQRLAEAAEILPGSGTWLVFISDDGGTNSWSTGELLGVGPVQQWRAALSEAGATFPFGFRVPVIAVVSDGTVTYEKWGAAEGTIDFGFELEPASVTRSAESASTFLDVHSGAGPWGSFTIMAGYSDGSREVLAAKMGGEGARYVGLNAMDRGDHVYAIGLLDEGKLVTYASKSVDTFAANSRAMIDAYSTTIFADPNGIVIRGVSDSSVRDELRIPMVQVTVGSQVVQKQGVFEGAVDARILVSNSWLARQETLSGVTELLQANEHLSDVVADVVNRVEVRHQIQFSNSPPGENVLDAISERVFAEWHHPQTLLAAFESAATSESVRTSSHPTYATIALVLTEFHPDLMTIAEVANSPDFMLVIGRELWVRALDRSPAVGSFGFAEFLQRLAERGASSNAAANAGVLTGSASTKPATALPAGPTPVVSGLTNTTPLLGVGGGEGGTDGAGDMSSGESSGGTPTGSNSIGNVASGDASSNTDDSGGDGTEESENVSATPAGTGEPISNSAPTSSVPADGMSSSMPGSANSTSTSNTTEIAVSTSDQFLIVAQQLNLAGFENITVGPTGVNARLEGLIPGLTIEFQQVQLREQDDGSLRLIGKASVQVGTAKLDVELRNDNGGIVLRDRRIEIVGGNIVFTNPSAKSGLIRHGLTRLEFSLDTAKNKWSLGAGFKIADKVLPLDFQWKDGVAVLNSGIENASIPIASGVYLEDFKFGLSLQEGVTGLGGRISVKAAPRTPKLAEGTISWTGGPAVQDELDVELRFLKGKIGDLKGKLTFEEGTAVVDGKGSVLLGTLEFEGKTLVNSQGIRISGTGTASYGGSIFASGQVSAALSADGNDQNDTIVVVGALRNGERKVHTFNAGRWEEKVVENLAEAAVLVVSPFGPQAADETSKLLNWAFNAMQTALQSRPTPTPPTASPPPAAPDVEVELPTGDGQNTTPSGNSGTGQGNGAQSSSGGTSGGGAANGGNTSTGSTPNGGGSSSSGASAGGQAGGVNVGTAIQSGAASLMTSALSNLIAENIREDLKGMPGEVAAQFAVEATRRIVEPLVKDVLSRIIPSIPGTIPTSGPIIQPGSFAGGVISLLPAVLGVLGAPKPVQDISTVVTVALYNPALLPLLPFVGWYEYSLAHNAKKAANSLRDALEKWQAVQVGVYSFAVRHLDTTDPEAVQLLSSLANLPGHPQDQEAVITSVKNRLGVVLGMQILNGRADLPNPVELSFRGWEAENRDAVRDNFVVDLASAAYETVYTAYGGTSRVTEFFDQSPRSYKGMRSLKALYESRDSWHL